VAAASAAAARGLVAAPTLAHAPAQAVDRRRDVPPGPPPTLLLGEDVDTLRAHTKPPRRQGKNLPSPCTGTSVQITGGLARDPHHNHRSRRVPSHLRCPARLAPAPRHTAGARVGGTERVLLRAPAAPRRHRAGAAPPHTLSRRGHLLFHGMHASDRLSPRGRGAAPHLAPVHLPACLVLLAQALGRVRAPPPKVALEWGLVPRAAAMTIRPATARPAAWRRRRRRRRAVEWDGAAAGTIIVTRPLPRRGGSVGRGGGTSSGLPAPERSRSRHTPAPTTAVTPSPRGLPH
jgi:hypothetical protein